MSKHDVEQIKGLGKVRLGAQMLLEGLAEEFGLDLNDPNFIETPNRIMRAYKEIFAGIKDTDKQVMEIINKSFPSTYDGIVLAKNVRAYSMCPHHFLPVEYSIDVAYIPSKDGRVVGISKLARLAVLLAKRPVLQEKFTDDVVDYLMKIPGALGAACIVRGRHFCMIMRGAKQPESVTVTSALRGVFMDDNAARQELIKLIELNK